jgi:hypothetical protein
MFVVMDANNELNKTLSKFTKYVVQQSKSNLTRTDKNVKKKLYNSIKGDSFVGKNSIGIYFEMEDYGEFQDKGVKGKSNSAKAPNSPFKFGKTFGSGNGGLTKAIKEWVKFRGLQFRQKEGKGVKGQFLSYDETAFLITRSIYQKGIKPSLFFSKPFEAGFKRLPDEVIEAYGLDLEKLMKQSLKI